MESEGNINLMSPAFPAKIGRGESASATVQFECTATLHFYAEVLDLGPRDMSDSQDMDLRDHDMSMLKMKLNGHEIFHTADSRRENAQIIIRQLSVRKGDVLHVDPVIPVFSVNEYRLVISHVCFSLCSLDEQRVHTSTEWY